MNKEAAWDLIDDLREEVAALRPKWTKEPPTKPGWHWARFKNNQVLELVEVGALMHGKAVVFRHGADRAKTAEDFDLWAGPIETPPLPEEVK